MSSIIDKKIGLKYELNEFSYDLVTDTVSIGSAMKDHVLGCEITRKDLAIINKLFDTISACPLNSLEAGHYSAGERMTTYGIFKCANPQATEQQIFDAGVREGLRRVKEGDYPKVLFTRDEVTRWRNDAFEASAEIVERYKADPWCADNIRALKSPSHGTGKFEPRYSTNHTLPVCNTLMGSFGVAVTIWKEDPNGSFNEVPMGAFYGMRARFEPGPPQFYYAGAVIENVAFWRYREQDDGSKPLEL